MRYNAFRTAEQVKRSWRLGQQTYRTQFSNQARFPDAEQFYRQRQIIGSRFSALSAYRKQIAWGTGALVVIYAANLERAPVSGRLRFMLVPQWLEMQIGEQAYAQTLQQFGPYIASPNDYRTKHVRKIMDRIIAVANLQPMDWQVHVVRGSQFPPNAFVLPGGKVFVFETLFPVCQNDDGLATVLSHETAHQVCRHTAESMSKQPIKWAFALLLYAITGIGSVDNIFTQLAFELPGSRAMENEADIVGLTMMARACFDPRSAIGLWGRMMKLEQSQGVSTPEFLSTHPTSNHRIENIREHLNEAEQLRSQNCQTLDSFKSFYKGY